MRGVRLARQRLRELDETLADVAGFYRAFGLALVASGIGGVVWAVCRLAVAYSGRERGPTEPAADALRDG